MKVTGFKLVVVGEHEKGGLNVIANLKGDAIVQIHTEGKNAMLKTDVESLKEFARAILELGE